MATDTEKIIGEIRELGDVINKMDKGDKYDKELGKQIKKSFSELVSSIEKFKPIDLVPVINIASDISKQNKGILDLVGRLINSPNDNKELISLVTDMVKRNNEFVSQFKKTDYKDELKGIGEALKERVKEVKEFKVYRDRGNFIDKVVPIYK